MARAAKLPDYAPMFDDYHRAFEPELRAMIASLPIREGNRVLDMACGGGAYSRWLAERVGEAGGVIAADVSHPYLEVARERTESRRVQFVAAHLDRLPFEDDAFDLVWCAQSLYSLPEPVDALRKMSRVARPGGMVAVLENDSLHQILLPWPIAVELAVARAELRAFTAQSDQPEKFYVGRRLRQVLHQAGLESCRERVWATVRQAPLGPAERGFLDKFLFDLKRRVGPYLDELFRERFERLVDPASGDYLLEDPDLAVTCLDHVACGVKPRAD